MAMTNPSVTGSAWTADLRSGRAVVSVQNQSEGGALFVFIGSSPPTTDNTPHFKLFARDARSFSFDSGGDGIYLRSEMTTCNALVF